MYVWEMMVCEGLPLICLPIHCIHVPLTSLPYTPFVAFSYKFCSLDLEFAYYLLFDKYDMICIKICWFDLSKKKREYNKLNLLYE